MAGSDAGPPDVRALAMLMLGKSLQPGAAEAGGVCRATGLGPQPSPGVSPW